jgi:membrane-bound inhibitor of C-type lysozyme
MTRVKAILIFGAALGVARIMIDPSPATAQTFQTYHCADGSQFIVGFYQYDKRAHLQIDGRAVALAKRLALYGSRYSGGGVTLRIKKGVTSIKHGNRPASVCSLQS